LTKASNHQEHGALRKRRSAAGSSSSGRDDADDAAGLGIEILWRGGLIGAVFYLAFSFAGRRSGSDLADAGTYAAAVLWCNLDGAFSRRDWKLALLEATSLYLIAMMALHFLAIGFGPPPLHG
jgi:hypothetical protein